MLTHPDQERELMLDLWNPDLASDLLKFVLYVYPWGQKGTPLADLKGPRKWQAQDLDEISQHIKDNNGRIELGLLPEMFSKGTVSGRGPGKSAEVSWLVHWMQSTQLGSTVIVTANGEPQLRSRTWPELGKWVTMAINSHWFDYQATSMRPAPWFKTAIERDLKISTGYYYAQAQLWREEAPDAFAGAHNPLGMMLLMDEASGIPGSIWSVCEGFFTEPVAHRYWMAFSNGRRNSGTFYDIFNHPIISKSWRKRQLDSRTVEGTDPKVYQKIIDKYGADSDEARVEVYGQFPNQGEKQFIANGLMHEAQVREVMPDPGAALVMGVDIARQGRDSTVIRFRQGRDGRSIPPVKIHGADNMVVVKRCAELIDYYNPDGVCIDAGNGTGVIDRLRELGYKVHEVWFGSAADDKRWDDKRTEMYAEFRDWLPGGAIDADPNLFSAATKPDYLRVGKNDDRIRLESKESLRERGVKELDDADAIVLTFAKKFARKDLRASKRRQNNAMATGRDDGIFTV